jgi:hypothetical protein
LGNLLKQSMASTASSRPQLDSAVGSLTTMDNHRSTTNASPTGGWKGGYAMDKRSVSNPASGFSYSPDRRPPSIPRPRPVSESYAFAASTPNMLTTPPPPKPLPRPASLRSLASSAGSMRSTRSLMLVDKPSIHNGSSKEDIDLADILDGSRRLLVNRYREHYVVEGCVAASENGFVLKATRLDAKSKSPHVRYRRW